MAEPSLKAIARQIDVVDVIDRQTIGRFQQRIILLCGLVAMFDGFDAQSIGFVAPIMANAFGIKIATFGPIFSANLVGMMIGAMVIGPLADRVGRKQIIVWSTFAFGLFSILTILANSFSTLMAYRLLTGFGLGAAMPNIISLTSEYAPRRARAWLITIMFVGFPLGAVVGGVISSAMLPVWGWKSVFLLGGIGPIALALILIFSLPESVHFLVHKGSAPGKIATVLQKIAPGFSFSSSDTYINPEQKLEGVAVKHLFTKGRSLGTFLLWIPFFMNLLVLFFMYNWLPPLLQQAGLPITRSIIAIVLFNVGGIIGGLLQARLIDRIGPFGVLGVAYALGALSIATIGIVSSSIPLIMATVFAAGFWVVGAQAGANALAASSYPTAMRSTGVGWALGVGRLGSIIGPLVGGLLMTLNWPLSELFMTAAIPPACAAIAILMLRSVRSKDAQTDDFKLPCRGSEI